MPDDDLQWSELINPEEFSAAWNKLKMREAFELDVTEHVLVRGYSEPTEYELLNAIHPSSLAHRTLRLAIDHSEVKYGVFVNDILIMFNWPMGWTWLPENSYSVGSLPDGWKNMRGLGAETINQLIEDKDTDSHNG